MKLASQSSVLMLRFFDKVRAVAGAVAPELYGKLQKVCAAAEAGGTKLTLDDLGNLYDMMGHILN